MFLRLPKVLLCSALPDGPGALSASFLQVCTAFTAEYGRYGHVKMHHGYTNVLGLGDSSTWRLPFLNRYVYMFLAPFLIPIITPLVAVGEYVRAGPCKDLVPSSFLPLLAPWRLLVEEARRLE